MSDMMGTALSALTTYQRALATTSHNIANANTEGYSRQRVDMSTRVANQAGSGSIGSGVQVASLRRVFDSFVVDQVRSNTAGLAREETFSSLATRVESVVSDPTTGINSALSRFFNAVQDVATDPSSLAARRVLLGEGDSVTARVRDIDSQLAAVDTEVNQRLRSSVDEINGFAKRIADLNKSIMEAAGANPTSPPNDLLDARDQALIGLNKLVKVSTVEQADGALNVFIGSGQSLVLSNNPQKLTVSANRFDPSRPDVTLPGGGVITDALEGGSLGGLIAFREEVLAPVRSQVGLLAMSLASQINSIQQSGRDLSGNAGQAFFSIPPVVVQSSGLNAGSASLSASVTSIGQLTGDNYRAVADGAGGFSLYTQPGNTAVSAASVGLTISLSGTAAAGDTFLIKPTDGVAAGLTMSLSTPAQIAAASGTGAFGVGDNSNALRMAAVENDRVLFGGTTSLADGMQNLVSEMASTVRSSEVSVASQSLLLEQSVARRDTVSGVNLDEEAANLMRYQQAYQAAAQVASVANTIFQTMIDTFRR
ncbi:MAG: flagellar hook-associated protein FlgK [Pseudomonadota bacterium]